MLAEEAYCLSKMFTKKSIEGIVGTLSGKNCTIKSTTKENGVTTVVFEWTADNGDTETEFIQIEDGYKSIDDSVTSEEKLWSSQHISDLLEEKLDNVKLTNETEESIIIYVDNVNGSDEHTGLQANAPVKTIDLSKVHKEFGYPKSILFILLSDYDVAGNALNIKGEQWIGIRGVSEVAPYKKIYSSVELTTLIKAERTQMAYNYLLLDGNNVTDSLVQNDCNCCYFDNVQGTTSNVNTTSLLNARRSNIMAKNSQFTSGDNVSFLSGYNSCVTLDTCSVNVYNLSMAVGSMMSKINGSITYDHEMKDDNLEYDLSIVRQSAIPTSLPANGGNAYTVNNHTVGTDVPENAGFTKIDDNVSSDTTTWSSNKISSFAQGTLASGTVWLDYESTTTLRGSVELPKDIKSATVTLVAKSDTAYMKSMNIAVSVSQKTLNVVAIGGGNFVNGDRVCVSYIATEY